MSDQPDDQHNLEQHIPGLRQAASNLSQIASASGFHLATIVITQPSTRDGAPAPPTRITFADPIQQQPQQMAATTQQPAERWISGPPPPQPHQWRPGEPLPPINRPPIIRPPPPPPPPQTTTPTTPTTTSPLPSPPASRPKRASTSVLETHHQSSPGGKRKRFSDPAEPLPGLTSAAFWGTVLEERPGAPTGMMPSQMAQPPQPFRPQPIRSIIPPIPPQQQQHQPPQPPEHDQPPQPQTHDDDRILRTATFPTLRLRSPTSNRQRNQILPSFPEQLAVTAPAVYTERQPSPEIPGSTQPRTQPGRSFLRRAAGQLLGRLSPFAGGPSLSRPSASRSALPEEQLFPQRQLTTSALPAIVPTPHRAAPEIFTAAQPPRDQQHPFEVHQLPPLQGYQPQPPLGQHSGSASGSGASHARTANNTTPPQAVAEGSRAPRSEAVSRGKRGRRAGATPETEPQFFECELCDSKFKRKSDKNRHVRVVHEKSRPFMCPMCEKTFGEKSNMLKHRASVHDDVRTFRCPYCEQSFSQRGLCDTHVRTVHDKKQAKYFCEHCGLPFSRKVQLHEHYDTVHPEYMATYGRFQAGQQSGTQAMTNASASRVAKQEPTRDRGGPAPTGQQLTAPEESTLVVHRSLLIQRGEAGPSDPQQWVQYPPGSGPPASNELQPTQQQGSRAKSFQEDSSGGNSA